MKMPIDREWFEKRAAAEGDLEIGASSHKLTMTLNLTDDEIAKLEEVALDALPAWARDRITVMRSALLAIRDADDIHPSSTTHDVEQSRHRFRDIARHALAGYAPSPRPKLTAEADVQARMRMQFRLGYNTALEEAAGAAYRVCAETRHVTLGDKAADAIRALAATATEGSDNG